GIPLNRIWVIVWFVAGITALVAGIIWGSKMGVQFSLTTVALRALPVIILGGLTSVPGAIIGGLIIGVGEKLSEVFLGPYVGGGIEIWFAYVLALVFLLFRPQGLFGEKIIDWSFCCFDHRVCLAKKSLIAFKEAQHVLQRKRSI
ncbi:MAG: High-affinity branched-chain amino acid transport system permease protein LivH, partial [Pseudomonadota bacterium]